MVASHNRHHAVREYLNGLTWDGTPRLGGWLSTYFGANGAPEPYLTEVSNAWPVSAVARAFEPGCKADHTVLIEGAQGIGKSSGLRALAGNAAWFADELADVGTKDAAQGLRGKWIIELSELGALRRSEVENIKPSCPAKSIPTGRRTAAGARTSRGIASSSAAPMPTSHSR